jgi:hypothetical protein
MKKMLFIIAALLCVAACEPSQVIGGRKVYKKYFNYILRDLASLQIHKENYILDGPSVVWEIDYSARNGLGGMTRETIKFTTISDAIFVEEDDGARSYYSAKEL